MVEPAPVLQILPNTLKKDSSSDNTIEAIKSRRSQELIIGLCGAIGSGLKNLKITLQTQLVSHGYHVELIRLSDLIIEKSLNVPTGLQGYERYTRLQDLGDNLRQAHSNSIIAELAVTKISILRTALFGDD